MKSKIWTDEEVKLLIELYPDTQMEYLCEKFGCSPQQIYTKVNKLKKAGCKILRQPYWPDDEKELLKNLYKKEKIEVLSNLFKRSESSIRMRAFKLGLTIKRKEYKFFKIDFDLLSQEPCFLSNLKKEYKKTSYLKQKLREFRLKNDIFLYKIKLKMSEDDIIFCKNNEKNRIKMYKMIKEKYPHHFQKNSNTKIRLILGKYVKNCSSLRGKYIVNIIY